MKLKIYSGRTLEDIAREITLAGFVSKIPNGFLFSFDTAAKRQEAIDAVLTAIPTATFDTIGEPDKQPESEPVKKRLFQKTKKDADAD